MGWIHYLLASLGVLTGLALVLLNLVSLPGTWLMILGAVVFELVDTLWLPSSGDTSSFGVWALGGAAALAGLGEGVEFLSGAAGARVGGASARGMWAALAGSIVGALLGTMFILMPLVGTLIGAVGGCALGAVIGEMTRPGMTLKGTLKPAAGAMVGRIGGLLGKTACGFLAWVLLAIVVFSH